MELHEYPGMKRALNRARQIEDYLRDIPFLTVDEEIAGLPARQLTARMALVLMSVRDPFMCGGPRRPEDVARFLWIVSPDYSTDTAKRDKFLSDTLPVILPKFRRFYRAIDRYLDRALVDKPAPSNGEPLPVSFAAWLVHEMGSSHGWTASETLDQPLACIYQYQKLITLTNSPRKGVDKAILFSRYSDRVKRRIYARYHERNPTC